MLGKPIYVLSGNNYKTVHADGTVFRPDLVEHYECGDCCIDLPFKDEKVQEFIGYVRLTALSAEYSKTE